ncbi:polysaccharide biosynthesis tyrosine autokinase [Salegentibacter sp. Hel_I_6]|uniref:GumC family protein n=1 Tax=Salegentibacter sp. Hel_I_6 TaxID=1250278 RepID=UPI00055DF3A9|nr:polysaccharide biosynthesis tyrosine autokinase [Salegentibacter sp. Hel_I_6]
MENNINKAHMDRINMRKEITKYLKKWPWFILCIIICCAAGYIYLRYTTPQYIAKTQIILKDDSSKNSESVIFKDLGIMSTAGTKSIENDLGILRSRRLMNEVVRSLNLYIQYYIEGEFNDIELYENVPFSIHVMGFDENLLKQNGGGRFEIWRSSNKIYKIKNLQTGTIKEEEPGNTIDLGFAQIIIRPMESNRGYEGKTIVQFSEINKIAANYRNKINFTQADENSLLIGIELSDPVKEKARDILDQLIMEFNRSAIEDKNLIAGNTFDFINERLAIINEELDSVETGKKIFKQQNQLTDIHAESQMFIQNASDYNKKRQEIGTQLELSNAMLEYISSKSDRNLLPSNLGLSEGGVNDQIDEYNSLILDRNRLLAGSSEKNPMVVKYNSQIDQIKANVVQSLNQARSNLLISQEDIQRQASSIGSKIYSVPTKELQYRGIERQQSIKETLYLFLLQKREENSLAMAITEPKAKIVDRAYFSDYPISPNSRSVYMGTFILGLFIPFSLIYINGLLDNKIRKRVDIESLASNIPLVGEIPKMTQKLRLIKSNDRSVLAEAFRILTTNLQYLLITQKNKTSGITFLVTSTIKGEGKTFTSVNLSITLANTSKKVLLIGGDLRNSKLQPFVINKSQKLGLCDYLADDSLDLDCLIQKSNLNAHLDILLSGNYPPNPYELLKTSKMGVLIESMQKEYDYIVIDTAPSLLVADTFLLTKFADIVLYIVKAGFTDKELLEFPQRAKEQEKFSKIAFILNHVSKAHLGYGNSYGYGYGDAKERSWSKKYKSTVFDI